MKVEQKRQLAQKRRWRVRARVFGTAERPRLCVHFSNKHVYAQCIDDERGESLVFVSSLLSKDSTECVRANVAGAQTLGDFLAKRALTKGIRKVVFDRGGRRYHGCVKSFADAARTAGLEF